MPTDPTLVAIRKHLDKTGKAHDDEINPEVPPCTICVQQGHIRTLLTRLDAAERERDSDVATLHQALIAANALIAEGADEAQTMKEKAEQVVAAARGFFYQSCKPGEDCYSECREVASEALKDALEKYDHVDK